MSLTITLNGTRTRIHADRLDRLLEELGFEPAIVATALNEQFVPRGDRASTGLADGDRLEVVAPLQGG